MQESDRIAEEHASREDGLEDSNSPQPLPSDLPPNYKDEALKDLERFLIWRWLCRIPVIGRLIKPHPIPVLVAVLTTFALTFVVTTYRELVPPANVQDLLPESVESAPVVKLWETVAWTPGSSVPDSDHAESSLANVKTSDAFVSAVETTEPCYGYVFVLLPEGGHEVMRNGVDDAGQPSRSTRFGFYGKQGQQSRWLIEEGAGVYGVLFVLSSSPLPPVNEWLAGRAPMPWPRSVTLRKGSVATFDTTQPVYAAVRGLDRGLIGASSDGQCARIVERLDKWASDASTVTTRSILFPVTAITSP